MKDFFNVNARAIINLGRESIKDHNTAIIELVKNSYDADASIIEIEIFSTNDEESFIRVSDDGCGMTEKEIENNWLNIGFSEKRENRISSKKRKKTGEKGIGRLSADRLGSQLTLKTKTKEGKTTGLEVDWSLFENSNRPIQDIKLKVLKVKEIKLPTEKSLSGTELEIKKLRHDWKKEDILLLKNQLKIFISPFGKNKITILIKNNIDDEKIHRIENQIPIKGEFDLELEYDGSENILYKISDIYSKQPKEDFAEWRQIIKSNYYDALTSIVPESLSCGKVKIRLLLYIDKIERFGNASDFRPQDIKEFIKLNAGVKIYRDDIHVKNSQIDDDWLGLAKRHAKNPAGIGRPSWTVIPSQIVGGVFISILKNPDVTDSASREGLIENQAYYDLRALTLAAIRLLESHRHYVYLKRESKDKKPSPAKVIYELKNQLEELKGIVKNLSSDSTMKGDTIKSFNLFNETADQATESIDELLTKNRVLSGLASLGISSAVFGHETQGALGKFKDSNKEAKYSLEESPPDISGALKELAKSQKYAEQVSVWGKFAIKRTKFEKRKRSKKKIHSLINDVLDELEVAFSSCQIELKRSIEEIESRVFPMDIESILINLLTNSYDFVLNSQRKDRVVLVELKEQLKNKIPGYQISVVDSGSGIAKENFDLIWEPFFSTKKDISGKESGTGLGLTIVKSIVEDLGGEVDVKNDSVLKGANFKIWIPRR